MKKNNYFKNRVLELYEVVKVLGKEVNDTTEKLVEEMDRINSLEDGDSKEAQKKALLKESTLNNFKFIDLERQMLLLAEIYSLCKLEEVELDVSQECIDSLESYNRYQPIFEIKAGKAVIANKMVSDMIEGKYDLKKAIEDGKKES